VAEHLANPAREVVKQMNVPITEAGSIPSHEPTIITVGPNETIQQAVDRAGHGDTIKVPYKIYKESVVIDLGDIKFLGIPNEKGEWPILDGEFKRTDGVIAAGNNFEMAFFQVKNYTTNGILVEGATGVYLHDMYIEKTGVYGVYPVRSTNVVLERLEATGMNDAGIYAGKCQDVIVRDNVVHGNVIGIEVENTFNAEMYGNHAYDNSLGLFVDLLPQLPSKISLNTKVYNNLSENNNLQNFAPETSNQYMAQTGTGLLILGADHVEVYGNTFKGNNTAAIGIFNLSIIFSSDEIDVGPNPEHTYIHDNTYENNGTKPAPLIQGMLGSGFDIIWDTSGADNRFSEASSVTSFPPALPSPSWPTPLYNLYWRALNFVVGLLG
jgi:parallel beta-helix repeat protein